MNEVVVHTISIDEYNRLRVFVHGSEFSGYTHIYRDASGVEWDGDAKCLYSDVPRKLSHADWYEIIVKAVSLEYGESLVLGEQVNWENVPSETQEAIADVSRRLANND